MQDVANQYGRDIEDTFEQVAMENELAKEYGITLAFQPFGQKLPAAPEVTGSESEPAPEPQPVREQIINLNPSFEVKSEPIQLNLKVESGDKKRKKSIRLVRNDEGMVIGAEEE